MTPIAMRFRLQSLSRFRPRILTPMVLIGIAAMLVLSNLTFDSGYRNDFYRKSYGWPLIWHRFVELEYKTIGWYYSAGRLAANSAMWLAMLSVPSLSCEWLLRRYRPRPRWSLRAMLVAVVLAAAACGWLASVRSRANLQDELIAHLPMGMCGDVRVTRWGPKWLDLFGADRFRRHIASIGGIRPRTGHLEDEQVLHRMAQLPKLQSLSLEAECITPALAEALVRLQQLRTLRIFVDRLSPGLFAALNGLPRLRALEIRLRGHSHKNGDIILAPVGKMSQLEALTLSGMKINDGSLAGIASLKSIEAWDIGWRLDEEDWHEFLAAIGKIPSIEHLNLNGRRLRSESLSRLASLKALKTLRLKFDPAGTPPLLSQLPALPRLEAFGVVRSGIGGEELRYLAAQPRLRLLDLQDVPMTAAALTELASFPALEELALGDKSVTSAGLESLRDVRGLRTLHLSQSTTGGGGVRYVKLTLDNGEALVIRESKLQAFRRALVALRQSVPGIVIVSGAVYGFWQSAAGIENENGYESWIRVDAPVWLPASTSTWMTPLERTTFAQAGGWAGFHGAARRDEDSQTVAVSF